MTFPLFTLMQWHAALMRVQEKKVHLLNAWQGWDSLHTAHAAELLSLTLQALEKLKESEELFERCLAARKKVLPEGHFLVAVSLVYLARLTLHKFASDLKNIDSDVAKHYFARAKQHSNDSIRFFIPLQISFFHFFELLVFDSWILIISFAKFLYFDMLVLLNPMTALSSALYPRNCTTFVSMRFYCKHTW